MSKFSEKLDRLGETCELQLAAVAPELSRALKSGFGKVAYAIGSGGSAVAAEYLSACRSTLQPAPTIVCTPMQLTVGLEDLSAAQIWIFSGRGQNADIVAALRSALDRQAREIVIVTSSGTSPLTDEAKESPNVTVIFLPTSETKDGFLATHTLFAAIIALLRSSAECVLSEPISEAIRTATELRLSRASRRLIWSNLEGAKAASTIFILHDPRLLPAATLLETSLWETALFSVQRVDFRNFAHGRHVWISKHPQSTFVIALTSAETRAAWDSLRSGIGSTVRFAEFDYGSAGRFESALSLMDGFSIIEGLGAYVNIDPGNPGVGAIGRSIYDSTALIDLASRLAPSVRQKRNACQRSDREAFRHADLAAAEAAFRTRLELADIGAIVLDYDGTIVESDQRRYEPPNIELTRQLNRLLDAGAVIALATGRGDSVGKALRDTLDAKHHRNVIVGYYNGAYIQTLEVDISESRPPRNAKIAEVASWIATRREAFHPRGKSAVRDSDVQISIEIEGLRDPDGFEADFRTAFGDGDLRITRSDHSIDIVLAVTCKTRVIDSVREKLMNPAAAIVCIGDSGHFGGNDHKLLGTEYGVSVGHVCDRIEVCWSFFGRKVIGPQALRRILSAIQAGENGSLHLDLSALK